MKERTLRGVHQGEVLIMGEIDGKIVQATIWSGMLLLARNKMPHPLVKQWRGRYIVGGRYWREVPHPFVKNPLNLILYPDTLMDYISKPLRWHRWPTLGNLYPIAYLRRKIS
jgi:hypothetical protein